MGLSNFVANLREKMAPPPPEATVTSTTPVVPPSVKQKLVSFMPEAKRITSLDTVSYTSGDFNTVFCKPGGTMRLRPIQNEMLLATQHARGLMAFVGVGHGKSVVANMIGGVFTDVDRTLMFAPASTLATLRASRLMLKQHFYLPDDVQFHSYEAMQRATPEGQLDYIEDAILKHGGDPARTLLVFDEAHALKNLLSARGARVMRVVSKYPALRVCMMSGSMTDNSIKECAHMAWMALREKSPFPCPWGRHEGDTHNAKMDLGRWAAVLDKGGEPNGDDWRCFAPLWNWAYPDLPITAYHGAERTNMARLAFQHRLGTCPGVVLSRETSLQETELIIRGLDTVVPEEVLTALQAVDQEGMDPDGNIVPDPKAAWRTKRQLAQGFYYVWDWPVDITTGKPIRDEAWLLARSTWNKMVRNEIKENGQTGYDSAFLVYSTIMREVKALSEEPIHEAWIDFVSRSVKDESPGVVAKREREALLKWHMAGGTDDRFMQCEQHFTRMTRHDELLRAWVAWSALHKHKQRPPTKAIWISKFLIDYAVLWAADQKKQGFDVIIWYDFDEIGKELARRGIPVYGAGTEPPKKSVTCALSIQTHSEGKNLQQWSRQIVLCPPASGKRWEQMLARTHRPGQTAQDVTCWVMQHVDEFIDALNGARRAADYAQPITGNAQKLLYATYLDIKVRKTGSDKFSTVDVASLDGLDDYEEE